MRRREAWFRPIKNTTNPIFDLSVVGNLTYFQQYINIYTRAYAYAMETFGV